MLPQRRDQLLRQHRHPVFEPLSLAHQDFSASEVHVLNAQSQALHHAHPRTVKQSKDQPRGSVDWPEQALHFLWRQHHGQTLAGLRRLDIIQPREIGPQHFLVEKQESALCLILRGCGNPPLHREVGEKRFDLARAHFLGMSLAMEKDETSHPAPVSLLRPYAIVLEAYAFRELVKEPFGGPDDAVGIDAVVGIFSERAHTLPPCFRWKFIDICTCIQYTDAKLCVK